MTEPTNAQPVEAQSGGDSRDPLTGLLKPEDARALLGRWLAESLGGADADAPEQSKKAVSGASSQAEHPHTPPHVMLIGLRRFQSVNLAYGEDVGDLALAEVARRLRQFAEEELAGPWIAARLGGRDFLLATREPCSRERWQFLGEEICEIIADPLRLAQSPGTLRLASRVALLRGGRGESIDALMDRLSVTLDELHSMSAGLSLWADGAAGESMAGREAEGISPKRSAATMESDLLQSIDRGEIEIWFQPQFAFDGDRLSGAEALARWRHPQLGPVGAGTLFALAERTDFTAALSRHILALALEEAAKWPSAMGHLRLALNITAADLAGKNFIERIRGAIAHSGFAPHRLTLEVTEQALVADLVRSAEALRALSEDGLRVAIDDFGTGFSNFRYLKFLPLHYLKLDRAMTADVETEGKGKIVLQSVIALAHALELQVVSEGVESQAQRDLLAREGCDYYQGYFSGRPMPLAEFTALALGVG